MSRVSVRLGPFQAPLSTVWSIFCWPFRQVAGTSGLSRKVEDLRVHVSAMTDILHIVVADRMGAWPPEQRERILRATANFTLVNEGLNNIRPQGNPLAPYEVQRLQEYTQRAQRGEVFSVEEAWEFRELSERAAQEYAGQPWVAELLKVAFFIFALYVLGELLKPKS